MLSIFDTCLKYAWYTYRYCHIICCNDQLPFFLLSMFSVQKSLLKILYFFGPALYMYTLRRNCDSVPFKKFKGVEWSNGLFKYFGIIGLEFRVHLKKARHAFINILNYRLRNEVWISLAHILNRILKQIFQKVL